MNMFDLSSTNITNLDLKLSGELPVNRDELLALVNTWGRNTPFYTFDKDDYYIKIESCHANEKYDLSNLDVSEITNFNSIFRQSNFNGNISEWDVSNATSMISMFYYAKEFNSSLNKWNISKVTSMNNIFCEAEKFNSPLDNWDTSKVTNMSFMFAHSKKFNQNLNSWDISKVKYINSMFEGVKDFNQAILWNISKAEDCDYMFYDSKIFKDKFNKGNELPKYTNDLKEWFIKNRTLMEAKNIDENKNKELDNFLSNFNIKEIYDKNI